MSPTTVTASANTHRGANRLILGIVLAVISFWLFAQTTLNVAPTMRETLAVVFVVAAVVFFRVESRNPDGFVDLGLFNNKTYTGATLSNFLLNGAAGTLLVALSLVQQAAALSSLLFNVMMVIVAIVAIAMTVPGDDPRARA